MLLSEDQLDALAEVVNIGLGRAAGSLSALIDRRIELRVPRMRVGNLDELHRSFADADESQEAAVAVSFRGAIAGRSVLAFPRRSGLDLTRLVLAASGLLDGAPDDAEVTQDLPETLEEVGNVVLNGVLGSIANLFGEDFEFSVPAFEAAGLADLIANDPAPPRANPACLIADARFHVADSSIDGALLLVFDTGELDVLLDRVLESGPAFC